jgi:hypothetical protein
MGDELRLDVGVEGIEERLEEDGSRDLSGINIGSGDDGSWVEEVLSRVEEHFVDWLSEASDSNSKSPMSC